MGLPCSICNHPDRAAIEQQIAERKPLLRIAATFGVSRSALQRHRDQINIKSAAAGVESQAATTLARLDAVYVQTDKVLQEALRRSDTRSALRSILRMENLLSMALSVHGRNYELLEAERRNSERGKGKTMPARS